MFPLSNRVLRLLEDIEERIDPAVEEDLDRQWLDFLYDRFDGVVFTPQRKKLSAPGIEVPSININDAVDDYEMMLLHQFAAVSDSLNTPQQNLVVRSNYGTGILSSLFGAELFMMPRENNTLPTTRSFNDTDKIREVLDRGMPDLNAGFGRKVFEFGEIVSEIFEKFPKIARYVWLYHPDTQGPLDICELLWGGEMFYSMYDEPELVHGMLRLITDTYKAFLNKWFELHPCGTEMNCHWPSLRHRGKIVLRNDSAMNLSPDFYQEFAAPYDGELLEHFDGGVVHFCGRGDHYIEIMSKLNKLYGINMSQPHLNDMETIYRNTVDKGIKILGLSSKWIETSGDANRPGQFRHNVSI